MKENFKSCRGWKMMLDQADLDFVCQAGAEGCDSCLQKGNVVPILCSRSGLRVNSQHLCAELRWSHKLGPPFFTETKS